MGEGMMKKLVVGVVLATLFSVAWAQVRVPMPMTCELDIPGFQKMMKDRGMVSSHESLLIIGTGESVALQVFTNPKRETVSVVWLDPATLCIVGSGGLVNIAKLMEATKKRPKPAPAISQGRAA
jgi:hypothetical protein